MPGLPPPRPWGMIKGMGPAPKLRRYCLKMRRHVSCPESPGHLTTNPHHTSPHNCAIDHLSKPNTHSSRRLFLLSPNVQKPRFREPLCSRKLPYNCCCQHPPQTRGYVRPFVPPSESSLVQAALRGVGNNHGRRMPESAGPQLTRA